MSPVSITCRPLSSGFRPAWSYHVHVTESASGPGGASAQAHQRAVDASGPGDTPRTITNRGSHAGLKGRRPHGGAAKKVAGGLRRAARGAGTGLAAQFRGGRPGTAWGHPVGMVVEQAGQGDESPP